MRQKTVGYALKPDGNPARLMKMRSECAARWGAIECVKNGNAPVLASQAKYLQRPPRGCERLNG